MTCPLWVRPTPSTLHSSVTKILVVGDSIAQQVANPNPGCPAPTYPAGALSYLFAGWSGTFHNYGRGGSAIAQVPDTPSDFDWLAHLRRLLDKVAPSTVIAHFLGSQGEPDATLARAHVLLDTCRANGVNVAWCIPPCIDPALFDSTIIDRCTEVANRYRSELAAKWKPDLRAVTSPGDTYTACLDLAPVGQGDTVIRPDGLHFNDTGQIVLADVIRQAMK